MITLQLINADIIDDTDTVTSRLFRKLHVAPNNGDRHFSELFNVRRQKAEKPQLVSSQQ